MIHPGDKGQQGYPVEDLEVDSEATMQDAIDLIGEYCENVHGDHRMSDAVINLIDFRKNDTFLWCSDAVPADQARYGDPAEKQDLGLNRVIQTNMFAPGLGLAPIEATPGDERYENPIEPDEFLDGAYTRLLRDWLRGNVIAVWSEKSYYRKDTGEEVYPQ